MLLPQGGVGPQAGVGPQVGVGPRRVLIVSAEVGAGHDATARALQGEIGARWPGSALCWVDALELMGPRVGPATRWVYVMNLEHTPWLYEFFYSALWRWPWFTRSTKWLIGRWIGRRLGTVIDDFDPDLIVSTYPLATAGLAWLRRNRGLAVPVGAWVSDFCPHPFWVYPEVDRHFVVHPVAVPIALTAEPGCSVEVSGPPVAEEFRTARRSEARARLGLSPGTLAVVVACGSYGFGAAEEAVRALLDAGRNVRVMAMCGRNTMLQRRLDRMEPGQGELDVWGWTDNMPTVLAAADLIVTNAGGATALEAMAAGVPVVMYRPVAGHGTADAALMEAVALAQICRNPVQLWSAARAYASRLGDERVEPRRFTASMPDLGIARVGVAPPDAAPVDVGRTGALGVVRLGAAANGQASRRGGWPVRAEDAAASALRPGTVGAVVTVGPRRDGGVVTAEDVGRRLRERLPSLPVLWRRHRPGRGAGEWDHMEQLELADHVTHEDTASPSGDDLWALDGFWSRPLPPGRPGWAVHVLSGHRSTLIAVKVQSALADALSLTGMIGALFDTPPPLAAATRRAGRPRDRSVDGLLTRLRGGRSDVREAARLTGRPSGRRAVFGLDLDAAATDAAAAQLGITPEVMLLGAVGDALRGLGRPSEGVRASVAVAEDQRTRPLTAGNFSADVLVKLPIQSFTIAGALVVANRLASARRRVGVARRPRAKGITDVDLTLAYLPRWTASQSLAGGAVVSVLPVLALPVRVPVGVGCVHIGQRLCVGVVLDDTALVLREPLEQALRMMLRPLLWDDPDRPAEQRDGLVGAAKRERQPLRSQ